MKKTNEVRDEDVIDLGDARVETKGSLGNRDDFSGMQQRIGLSDE